MLLLKKIVLFIAIFVLSNFVVAAVYYGLEKLDVLPINLADQPLGLQDCYYVGGSPFAYGQCTTKITKETSEREKGLDWQDQTFCPALGCNNPGYAMFLNMGVGLLLMLIISIPTFLYTKKFLK